MDTAINNEQTLAKRYELDQPMGVEQRQAMDERKKAYNEYKSRAADRDFANYAAGLVGVPGSGNARYEQSRSQRYKDEAEFQREQIKDLSALETTQRAAREKRAGLAGTDFANQQTAAAAAIKDKATVAAQMFNISSQAASNAAQNMTSLEVARINAASAARPGETERIMATAIGLKATDPVRYAAFMETLGAIKGAGKPDQNAAIADKAFDNVTAMAKGNIAMQLEFSKNPQKFQDAVAAETTRLRGSAGGAAGTMTPDRANQFKVLRPS
jgi:hypothetical protein